MPSKVLHLHLNLPTSRCFEECLFWHDHLQEEIQRYLMFARQFKPKIREDSAEYMVEEYKRLRQRDSGEPIFFPIPLSLESFLIT